MQVENVCISWMAHSPKKKTKQSLAAILREIVGFHYEALTT